MESDDAFEQFSPPEELTSPVSDRKLKRLKKAKTAVEDSSPFETPGYEKPSGRDEEPNLGSGSRSAGSEEGNELSSGIEGWGTEEDGLSAKRALDFDSVAEQLDGKREDRGEDMEMEEESRPLRKGESEKKRRPSDGLQGNKKKDDKKRLKSVDFDELPVSSASIKMTKKERRERFDQLRAESQRLLRETRDAAFKPIPFVQKPISSVLEKIRRRKLEISKKFVTMRETSFVVDDDGDDDFSRKVVVDVDSENITIEESGNDTDVKIKSKEITVSHSSSDTLCADGSSNLENHLSHENGDHSIPSQVAVNGEPNQAFRAPIDDSQALFSDSQTSDSKDELPEETPSSPLEEVLAPSLLAMNLKFDSGPPDDTSSDEEDNDKENIDPGPLSSSPNGDPVKAFVDDEADEEDDSDNDLLRFKDDEEDEDDEDDEEFKDLIATAYEEGQIDTEKRNELHQKWLEQQDAAGTENLLQRLKCGLPQREPILLEEKENAEDEEDKVASDDDEAAEDLLPTSALRMNMKKLKEMIPQMFTDKDDVYISSDDEEMEKKLVKQSLFAKAEEQAKLLSPAKDESSKELFGRIRKVNNVSDNRRKAKTSSFPDKPSIGGNRNISSKSSFLGRGSNHFLPPSQKRGSSAVRSFIFEREDSSGRSSVSMAEDSSDPMQIQQEKRPTKTTSAKFSNLQTKSTSESTSSAAEASSCTSLYEILKRPSHKSSPFPRDTLMDHTESIFAAFKLEKKAIKKESSKSL